MGVLFKNQFILTKECTIETAKIINRKQRIGLLIMSIIYIIAPIIIFMLYGFDWNLLFVCAISILAFLILRSRITNKVRLQLYQQQSILHHHEPIIKTVTVFEDYIEHHSGNGAQLNIFYDRITYAKKASHFMMLMYEKAVIVPIDMSGFTKGTSEEFEVFLLEKGIKVK